jgi:hypothetical protein
MLYKFWWLGFISSAGLASVGIWQAVYNPNCHGGLAAIGLFFLLSMTITYPRPRETLPPHRRRNPYNDSNL